MDKVADFYAKVMASEDLQDKLGNILQGKNIVDATDDDLQKIGEVAKAAGFDITLEAAKAYIQSDEAAVSDEALDAVAGGNQKGKFECKGEGSGNKDNTSPSISLVGGGKKK